MSTHRRLEVFRRIAPGNIMDHRADEGAARIATVPRSPPPPPIVVRPSADSLYSPQAGDVLTPMFPVRPHVLLLSNVVRSYIHPVCNTSGVYTLRIRDNVDVHVQNFGYVSLSLTDTRVLQLLPSLRVD